MLWSLNTTNCGGLWLWIVYSEHGLWKQQTVEASGHEYCIQLLTWCDLKAPSRLDKFCASATMNCGGGLCLFCVLRPPVVRLIINTIVVIWNNLLTISMYHIFPGAGYCLLIYTAAAAASWILVNNAADAVILPLLREEPDFFYI